MITKLPIGEIVPGGGGFKFDPGVTEQMTIKATPIIDIPEQTAEVVLDVVDEPEFYFEELLYGPVQAEEVSKNLAESHLRPLSNSEYQNYLDLLARGYYVETGEPLYDHERTAIALLINGNFLKYYGNYQQDPLVQEAMSVATTLTKAFAPDVSTAYKKMADFLRVTAASVPEKYTDAEKQSLAEKGIAFVIMTTMPTTTKAPGKTIETVAISSLDHPMLSLGLLPRKADKAMTRKVAHPMLTKRFIPQR